MRGKGQGVSLKFHPNLRKSFAVLSFKFYIRKIPVNRLKKAFAALSDRQILPIFLLYFITSAAFLVFFAQMFYEREKHFILDRDVFIVRDLQHHLQNKLQKKRRDRRR